VLENLNDVPLCEKFLATLKLCKYPKWKCYLKRISGSHLVLTFVPASFADLKLLMLNQSTMESQCSKSVKFFANPDPTQPDEDKLSLQESENLYKDSLEKLENLSIPESHSVPEMCEQIQQGLDLAGVVRSHLPSLTPFRERAYSLDAEQRKRSLLDFRKRTRTCSMDSRHKKKFSLQPLSPPRLEDVQQAELPETPAKMEIPPNHTPQFGAVSLPIFVYDCPLNMLIEVLVFKESDKKAADIFDDNSCSKSAEEKDSLGENLASPEPKSEDSDNARGIQSI